MNDPTMETLTRRLDHLERENRRLKRVGALALAVMAAVVLMGQVTPSNAAAAEVPPRPVFVERDFVSVYSQMATTSDVVFTLMRGNLVAVDFVVTSTEGPWCRIEEVAGGRSGFVLCEWLGAQWPPTPAPPTLTGRPKEEAPPVVAEPPEAPQASPKPSRVLTVAEKPAPKPMAEVTEPEVKRERRHTLQVASLVLKRNVLALNARLEKLGYTPVIRMTTVPITRHRVYGGEFSSREEAEMTARRLNADKVPTNLVELEDGTFRLEVGSFFDLKKATDLAQALEKKNYTPKIDSKTAPTPVHQVRVGEYENRAEAQKAVEALNKKGFTPLIVRQ